MLMLMVGHQFNSDNFLACVRVLLCVCVCACLLALHGYLKWFRLVGRYSCAVIKFVCFVGIIIIDEINHLLKLCSLY